MSPSPFSTHLTFLSDSGHGWLRVPLAELDTLGIREAITAYSYHHGTDAYLEEDVDAATYLDARAAQGGPPPQIVYESVDIFAGRAHYARFPAPRPERGE